jgi:hypothetical protein
MCLTVESNSCRLEIVLPEPYCIREINQESTRHPITGVIETTGDLTRQSNSDIIESREPRGSWATIRNNNPKLDQHSIPTQQSPSLKLDMVGKELADRAEKRIREELENLLQLKERRKEEALAFRRIHPLNEPSLSDSGDDSESWGSEIEEETITGAGEWSFEYFDEKDIRLVRQIKQGVLSCCSPSFSLPIKQNLLFIVMSWLVRA